ncbi:FAD/NAD(P)-binding protein [Arthrobacter sp. Br18]|uniref:FAD/NAD(P)-binding protein n=1 Tax=Arthrobacter sp. Br18 TaxID=1312954 RepID=UPI0012DD7350|nr:FAD/NAD(P)-binding protein [Arthrobacter sp. Br18]
MNRGKIEVAVIGGGPRGTSVVERLIARQSADGEAGVQLVIHVLDRFEPGPGHVWRTDQSRLFLMNTPALFPTVVPVGAAGQALPASPVSFSFDQWRALAARGGVAELPADDIAEAASVGATGFPSRKLYGRYLAWVFLQLVERAGDAVVVVHHPVEVLAVRRQGAGWALQLDDGGGLEVDTVVLAAGHLPAKLTPEQEKLQDGAARYGLQYWPPAVPADVDWKRLPAGKPVLVRGLGLNFFDAMIQLTEGRGGRFTADSDGRLAYSASGREPRIIAASRRGVPYRARAATGPDLHDARETPSSPMPAYCTPETLAVFARSGIQPGFDHDFWPLLHRDVLWAYYGSLARVDPRALLKPPAEVLAAVRGALDRPGPEWQHALGRVLERSVPAALRLDVEALGHPFAGSHFEGGAYDDAVLRYLDADAAGSAPGVDDPLKMAIRALNAGRSMIKEAAADGGLTDAAWTAELRGWFEPLVEGLAGGPPQLRILQLAALVRAGLVHFVGPDPKFGLDTEQGLFRAVSPWVGTEFTARYLVEAMMPANRASTSSSVLMRQLLAENVVRPHLFLAENRVPVASGGLDVTAPPYRVLNGAGAVQENFFVIGLQLASVQWGTAIAAEAGASLEAGGRTLRDADDIARAIVVSCAASAAREMPQYQR